MTAKIPTIFDLTTDENGITRMPFNPIDYGENNSIMRTCHDCEQPQPQGKMKELGSDDERAYHDGAKWWPSSIFFCKKCWTISDYSDASNWTA